MRRAGCCGASRQCRSRTRTSGQRPTAAGRLVRQVAEPSSQPAVTSDDRCRRCGRIYARGGGRGAKRKVTPSDGSPATIAGAGSGATQVGGRRPRARRAAPTISAPSTLIEPVSCESAWSVSGSAEIGRDHVARPHRVAVNQDDEQPQHDGAAAEEERQPVAAERAEAREHADGDEPPERRARLERLAGDDVRPEQPDVEDARAARRPDARPRCTAVRTRASALVDGMPCRNGVGGHGSALLHCGPATRSRSRPPGFRQPAGSVQNLSMNRTSAQGPGLGAELEPHPQSSPARVPSPSPESPVPNPESRQVLYK